MHLSKQALIYLGRYRSAAQASKDILDQYRAFSDKYPLGSDVPDSERGFLDKLISDHNESDRALDQAARLLAHYVSEDFGGL